MPRSSEPSWKAWLRDPRHAVRAALGVLLAANLAAAGSDLSLWGLFLQADIVVKVVMLLLLLASLHAYFRWRDRATLYYLWAQVGAAPVAGAAPSAPGITAVVGTGVRPSGRATVRAPTFRAELKERFSA